MASEKIEDILISRIVDKEFASAKANAEDDNDLFDSYIDLIDSVREPKDYDWMSDIRIPEFVSHMLTQASIDANQYFSTRDFVEAYLEDEGDEAKANAEAAKECVNRTLNQRHLYHYHKYMRGKSLTNITGRVYARCWWEQKTIQELIGTKEVLSPTGFDVEGFPMEEGTAQVPAFGVETVDEFETKPVIDRFNYDIINSKNVFTDNKYCYSIQEKDWVIIRDEVTIEQLFRDREDSGYFNLDKIGKIKPDSETETSRNSYNSEPNPKSKEDDPINKYYDRLERYGKYWCKILDVDENGEPSQVDIGLDDEGKPLEGAKFLEVIQTFIVSGSDKTLIRFQLTPYIDFNGVAFKPLLRGLCYIHPTEDAGMGDGKHVRELQLALDDTYNVSNDRVMLATMPTFKVKRYEAEDNPDIYMEPGHKIPLENIDDLEELRIDDNAQGALNQMQMLKESMQQVDAIFPTTMGGQAAASTTATAIAGAEGRTDMRSNYKALTFENTFLTEMYWMILNMTWTFAHPDTGEKLMGKKVENFHPDKDYFYKPLSQTLEPEYAKTNKIQLWTQIMGNVVSIQHPDTVVMVNYIMTEIAKLMGDEFVNFTDKFLGEDTPIDQGTSGQQAGPEGAQTSNEQGLPVGALEQGVRQ